MEVILKEHLSHVRISGRKVLKINGQNIYNGKLNPFSRAKVMTEMHKHIKQELLQSVIRPLQEPIYLKYTFVLPKNYGSVRNSKKGITWHICDESYVPNWDIDNVSYPWIKAFQDTLKECKLITEDNVSIIKGYSTEIEYCNSFSDRQIKIEIIENYKKCQN